MARLISRKQVEEIQDFIKDTSFAQGVSISGSLLVSQSFNLGSDPDEKSTITGSVELTGSLTIDGALNVVGDQALDLTSSVSLESLDSLKFGGITPEDFGAMDATIYVSSTSGDDSNDGRTPQFPLRTVKKAAELATAGDDGRFGLPTGSLFTGFRIEVAAGTYLEQNPIELPKNTTVWGAGLRVTKIVAKNENEDLFWVNSGCYLSEMTFAGLRVFPSVDNSRSGFAIAFAPNSFITTSPYVQNCSMISNQENSFLEAYEAIPAGGGGLNVDGNIIHPDSPLASMVLDAYTQIAPNGVGCQVVGRGFIQLVSFFTNFSAYSVKVLDGGQAVLLNSNTSFGDFGMYASGSRFITGSGGNIEAFNRVRDNYTIIIDTIEDGLSAIPEFVPNTNAGIKVTDELQQFSSNNSSDAVAEQAKSEYRLVSNIVSSGISNIPSLLAKSATRGYNTGSVWNVSFGDQITGSTSATSTELAIIEDRFDKVKETLEFGARVTASYTLVDNIDGLIKVGNTNPYVSSDATSQTEVDTINRNFNTVLQIVEYGLNNKDYPLPALTSSNAGNIKVTETPQYNTDISSSAEVANKVSSSFATVYRILELGSDYAPTIIQSSSFENPSIDYQNGYDTLLGNLSFIQNETIAYLSSSWSESDYNEETCKRDIGFIVSGAAHDLLYGGNEESVLNGNFYYLYPSEATASQKQETLDAIRYAGGLAENLVGDVTYVEPSVNVENGYDLLVNNKSFIQNEVISFVSSSWRGFEYDEVKCKRDVGHVINAVATDLRYGGNERSRIAGEFYYLYPSTATTTQLLPTLDGIEWARDLSKKLVVKDTFVTASAIIQSTYDLIVENRSLVQEETVNFIDTQFPNLVYLKDKCKRDTGFIIDAVATDLYYGGNQKSVRAGLYYGEIPSKVNGDQLNETVDGISYAKSFIDKVIVNEIVESPSVIDNTYSKFRVGDIIPFSSSLVSGSETERVKVSSSFGLVEDIIKQGEDSLLAAIAGNTPNLEWTLEEPKLVSSTTLVTSSITASNSELSSISQSFEIVTTIIESGSSITSDIAVGFAPNGLPISQVGIPKNSYGDNLITTTIGTTLPNNIVEVSNVADGIKFNNNTQYISSISASTSISSEISESFRTVIDIVEYGISGSKEISGSANSSSYFEVISLPNDSTAFYINDNQLKYFDGREGWRLGGEDTGSFLGSKKDPTLTLVRNEMYTFSVNDLGFEDININAPFLIKTKRTAGTTYDVYESVGLINNGITFGTITFTPLADTPDTLYYVNPTNVSASGVINIVDSLPLSSEQEFVYVPTKGEFEKVVNTKDNIKITTGSQYTSSLDASVSDRNIVSGGFSTVVGILKSGIDSFTPTAATYNPADGEFVMTVSQHGLDVGDRIYLRPESFVFTCDMDGNRTEHKLPSVGQPAYNKQLTINSITDDTITVNVGKSGPNIEFNPTNASYDPATGDFVTTVGKHTLSVGEGIILSPESFAFTCDMDDDQSVKSYPRVGIDPFAVRSIPITSVTDTTLTFNVGASGPNKYFTPSSASYNALTGDMIVTVGQHGLGVGRSVVLKDESFAFTCDQDSDATIHSYPRPGSDPYAGKSIEIKSVGNTQHTPTNAPYDASTGIVTLTIAGHGFSNGDYVKVDDGALTYTCVLDGNTVEKSYPRAGYDYPSGRWLEISNVTTDTFDINIGASSYKSVHTFVSATNGGIRRQTGTFTINVGDGGTASNSLHTFVSASANAVKHEPQSVHTFVSASRKAIKHLPQSVHTFVRTNENSVSTLPILTKNIEGLVKRSDVNQFTSSLSGSENLISKLSSSFETVLDIIEFGTGSTPTTATYDPADGDFVMTIPNHKFRKTDSIYLKPESFTFTCEMDDNKTEHKLPSVGQPAYNSKLRIKSVTDSTVTVNVGKSGPNLKFNPTNATYDPATGDFVITTGTHSLSVGEGIILDIESFAFTCDMDDDQSVKSYPRLGIDPYAGRSMIITDVTDTTMTVNVGASGPNKYFTPSDVNYNALTGEMVLTVGQHGLGVSRSVVLENESFAFTCDQDGDSSVHSYPRSGSDPYAEQSIEIISVGTTSHTPTNAPYNPTTGIVTLTIANHGFSNNDYIKVDDGALTYTCVLDGNTTQKSYPRTGIDYPSGRWLQISNVTTNTFDINIGSSSYTGAHTFVSATTNGIKRQDGTFTINVGDGGSASGSIHTFVSASTNAVKHEPQSLHTFVSSSYGAVKHLPQSVHTFVRTIDDSVTVIPPKVENIEEAISVTTETQYVTSSISASAADISFISESFEIVTRIIEFGSGSYESSSLYGSEVTASSTVAAYNLLKSNIDFIKEETIAYLSSSWSTASYDEDKCKRDVAGIVSGAAEDLIHNVYSASIFNGKFYLEYPSQAQGSQLNQTLDGIRYASRVAQKVASNVTFSNPSQDRLDTQTIINNNKEFIKEEGIAFLSASWSDFDYPEETCKRDIVHILDASITDIVYGGNERTINAGVFYWKYPSEATGSQLFPTLDGIEYAGEVAQKVVSGAVFTPLSSDKVNAYNLVLENRDLIQNEVIEYVSSSWNAADYDDVKCKRDTGYIIDAAITDLLYGGNERSIIAGDFYYKYPSQAQGSQLDQTVDGIVHAQRLSDKVMSNTILVNPSVEREGLYQTIERNRELVQAEVISYISSSWVGFDYDEAKCSRDVGHILDAVSTDLRYGGNERSVIAGEYYYLYPSEATSVQKTQTIDGIVHAANLVQKLIQNVVLVQPSETKLSIWNTIRDNRSLIQKEVTEYIDYTFPFFTYNREKCRRDVGHILDGVATDFLWGGNQRSIKSGEFYYLFPSEATTVQKVETIEGIVYAKNLVRDIITQQTLLSPSKVSNSDGNIKVTSYNSISSSIALSGSYQTEVSESYDIVTGIIKTGIESFTPKTATYDPANGDFVMTVPKHNLYSGDSIYLKPESFTFTCDMDGNRTEHKLPSVGQPAYDNRLTIKSTTSDTITVNVGKSGPNVEYNPTTASYDPATGEFVVTVASHSLSVGEGVVMEAESFAFTCDMDNNQSVKSYPRVGIDPYSVRSLPLTDVTDTTMTFNVGASGPNKYFTPVSASYNALSGDMTLTVSESFGLGVGRSVVLENESFAFTCDQDSDATTHSYPRPGSDPYAGKSIVITSVGTTSHTVTDAPYDSATGDVTITIANHNFNNGDYIKLDDNSLTYTCVLDNNTTTKSYPRPNYDYPSGRWLEISNVTTNTFDINIGSSPYVGSHTFVSATTDGLERQDGTFTINVGDGGSASGSLHTFVSASNRAVKHEPQSVHTFVSASNGALKHLPQSAHTFIRTDRDSVSTLPVLTESIEGLIKINDTTQFTSSLSGSDIESAYVTRSVGFINDIIRLGTDDIPFALAKWYDDTLDTPQQLTTGSYTQIVGPTLDSEYNNGSIISLTGDGSDFFKKEVTVNGVRIVVAGDVGGQTAVPDAFTEKVARMFELFTDPSGSGINETFQRNLIKTLSGDSGTYHAGLPTIQRVARGAGSDYTPNFLDDAGILYWNLTNLLDTHVQNDMVWYLNSTGDISGSGDIDAQEVIEHIFHTLHMHGLPADDIKLYSYLASDWQTGDLYLAMEEAYDAGLWDSSGYGGNSWKTDSDAFEVAAKEYLYLLNFAMFEYTDLWENGSLSPEWDDSMRTQAGILANNPLGYAFHNTYISPTISKPSLATIRSIFQDGDLGDPTIAGESGYVVTPTGTYTTDTEFGIVSSSFGQIINIIENGTGSFTPTTATYDPSNGNFVVTIPNHTLDIGDEVYIRPESFTFTCTMDGNKTEHKLPSVGQPAYTNKLEITSKTDDTITVNVGASGPNVEWTPNNATYDPATGDFVITTGTHTLSVGEGIVLDTGSFAFTCDMDNNQSTKSYPRFGIDPYAGRSMKLTSVTSNTMTVNVGVSGPNKYFTPVSASYNALSGDMTLTVSESLGLGVGRSVVLENESIAFTCDMDSNATTHSYPRSGSDPYAEQSIVITSVGKTQHTPTNAPYNSATGIVTLTIANHGFSNGDYVKVSDNALTYTCVLDDNTTTKSYPRPGYDYPSGRWLEISNVTTNTFTINIGSSSYIGEHKFISAAENSIERQTGTFTINVGDAGSASGSIHTFVSASANAVKHEPQSVHTFVSASKGAVKHLPQAGHTFVRTENNSISVLPKLITNAENNIKVTSTNQFTSLISGSSIEINKVNTSVGIIENILQNGLGVKPTVVKNNSDIDNLIKVTDSVQFTSESFGDRLQQRLISSSIAIVTTIVENGTGSLPTVVEYGSPSESPKTLAAYNLLKENIEFIQSESIAYLSSSWSTASYNEQSCSRDIGAIISGAAEDMLYNANSSSIFNGKFYYDIPSQAQGVQLQQTLDGINYAGRLAESIVRGYTFQTASAVVSGSYELIRNNREFIENETIEFLSSSWDGFTYNEITCKRDITHIIDAVSTDLLYGGNERSVNAGDYYYRYPSAAISGGVPNENRQKDPTVTAIDYVQNIVTEIVNGKVFQTASNEVEYVYEAIRENREFLQAETVAFVNAKYPNFEYNELSCSRDTGFIIDAVATDLRYGGNQRALTAGEFYYRFPSEATGNQLDETTDALIYTKDLIEKLVNKETLFVQTGSLNTDNGIKVTSFSPATGGNITDVTIFNTISSSFAIVSDAIANGTGSTPTSSNYGAVSTDSDILTTYGLITESVPFIQNEVVAYISSSWVGFDYNEASCSRDVGFIVNGVAEDLRYGIVSASSVNARYYYQFPSEANGTGSQAQQTIDGINYAYQLTEQIVKGVTFDFPSAQISASVELIRNNREFIQSESISYLSSSWEGFDYVESTCMRDVGHILDAVSTDLLYGGNQRSKIAGEYYYKYPSSATSTQLEPTTTGIKYAGDVASRLVENEIFVTASAERLAGNKVLLDNKEFIQNEVIAYLSSSWSTFDYNEDKCKRDTGYILNGVATDFLYGGNERGRVNGEYYYLYPSDATVNFQTNPNGQLNQTIDGINYSARLAEKVMENTIFVNPSSEVSASAELLRRNRSFVQNETIEFISSSWSNVTYNEDKCRRDTGYIIDAAVTDLVYGGNERSRVAGLYYWRYPSRATKGGTPSEANQLDPTIDGIRFANGTSQNVVQNLEYTTPSAEITNGVQLLRDNTTFIQKETIAYLSSSWSEFEYNEVSCSRDLGYIIDAVATDLTYGGNARAVQAGTFYYYIPSIATTEQKPQTTDGIDFSKGLAEKIIKQQQLVFPFLLNKNGANALRAEKKVLQGKAISYTNAAFPNFDYNEEKCYRDTGFILDAIATDIIYGGNERSIRAAESYYTGVYGSAAVVINEQKKETAETNRYLRTQFQFAARQAPVEEFGSLIITTGHDFSYAGAGVTYKALPPNQGGDGVPDPDKEITEIGGGRVFFTSGNELGDFRIGGGLVIKQASGTLEGRTFSKSLFSLVTPFSLALQD